MAGWIDGWMDGWVGGWMGGRMNRQTWTDGHTNIRTDRQTVFSVGRMRCFQRWNRMMAEWLLIYIWI